MFELKDWFLVDMGAFIEARGFVVKHEYFGAGDFISTAPIKNLKINEANQSILFSTSCGTEYILRFSEINEQKCLQTQQLIIKLHGGQINV